MKRKDVGDVKKGIGDAVGASKEIIVNKSFDAKAEAQKTADTVEEFGRSVVNKTKNAADDIKKGAQDVGRDVKQTAVNVSRGVTSSKPPHQTKRINRTQS